jgi:8-oxo-dGTP pyrophosphatase MutT (NUDIX family)
VTIKDELVDEVDEHGNVLRVVTRAQMRAEVLCHRATYIGVVSTDGHLLIHQRSPDKEVYPSYWDVCAGGVCTAGEDWEPSARRELQEELGITVDVLEDRGGGYWIDEPSGASLVGRVFLARHDGPFSFDDGEVVDARFVTFDELDALLAEGTPFCPDSVELALPRLRGR